jgi:hypothetical protein
MRNVNVKDVNFATRDVNVNGRNVHIEFERDYDNDNYVVYVTENYKEKKYYIGVTNAGDVIVGKGVAAFNSRSVFNIVIAQFNKSAGISNVGGAKEIGNDILTFGIKNIGISDVRPVFGLTAARALERDVIKEYVDNGYNVINDTDGGEYPTWLKIGSVYDIMEILANDNTLTKAELAEMLELSERTIDAISKAESHRIPKFNDENGTYIYARGNKLYLPIAKCRDEMVKESILADYDKILNKKGSVSVKDVRGIARRHNFTTNTTCTFLTKNDKDIVFNGVDNTTRARLAKKLKNGTITVQEIVDRYGVKYITAFNWLSYDDNDIKRAANLGKAEKLLKSGAITPKEAASKYGISESYAYALAKAGKDSNK